MRNLAAWLLAAAVLVAARPAHATSIDFSGEDGGGLAGIRSMTFGVAIVHSGEIEWQWVGGPPDNFSRLPFYTYAISADDDVARQTIMLGPGGDVLAGGSGAGGRDSRLITPFTPGFRQNLPGDPASVLQDVINEATNGLTTDPPGDRFFGPGSNPTMTTAAQSFLTSLATDSYTDSFPTGFHPGGGDGPGGCDGGGGGQGRTPLIPTPEPASLTLFGTGLLLVVSRLRRASRA